MPALTFPRAGIYAEYLRAGGEGPPPTTSKKPAPRKRAAKAKPPAPE